MHQYTNLSCWIGWGGGETNRVLLKFFWKGNRIECHPGDVAPYFSRGRQVTHSLSQVLPPLFDSVSGRFASVFFQFAGVIQPGISVPIAVPGQNTDMTSHYWNRIQWQWWWCGASVMQKFWSQKYAEKVKKKFHINVSSSENFNTVDIRSIALTLSPKPFVPFSPHRRLQTFEFWPSIKIHTEVFFSTQAPIDIPVLAPSKDPYGRFFST